MEYAIYALIGAVAGVFSGMFGIGGGILVVPSLVILLGYSQQKAQGTSLAVFLLPVGLLAALNYYKKGNVEIAAAGTIALALFFGGYLGSRLALALPESVMRRLFALFLMGVSAYLFLKK